MAYCQLQNEETIVGENTRLNNGLSIPALTHICDECELYLGSLAEYNDICARTNFSMLTLQYANINTN